MNVVQNKKGRKRGVQYKQRLHFELRDDDDDSSKPEKVINQQLLNLMETNNNSEANNSKNVLLCLTEGRGQARGEVGIAAIDLNSPVLILCQISDGVHYTDTLNKIQIINPNKILVPDTMFESMPFPKLLELIKEIFPFVNVIPVQRRHYNDKYGMEQILKLCSRKSFNILQIIARKYYCLSSASALLSYLKNISLINFAEKCLKIEYQTKGGVMIDTQTSVRLELLYSLNMEAHSAKKFSLFAMLNKCETKIGQRHLRSCILEPSCDLTFIERRHEQIKILIENEDIFNELKENLQNFCNAEALLKISFTTPANDVQKALQVNIQMALLLKNCLEAIKPLSKVINNIASESFEDARQLLMSTIFDDIIEKINTVVQPNIHENKMAKKHFLLLYTVRAGANETIDTLRQLYSESIEKIREYVARIADKSLLPIKMIFTTKLGYHILLKNSNNLKPPENFEIIYRKGLNSYFTTPELIALNEKIHVITKNIIGFSNSVLCSTLLEIAKEIDVIYHLIGIIIDLDIVQSLAEISNQESYCCPKFTRVLRLEDAFHPMLTLYQNEVDVVKNNVIATPQYNFFLIQGPNMSGKSIYIKMIAVIQVMAQIGCFVPAKAASIRLSDKIFSRLGFQDNIEHNASSFTVELRDMEYIYSNITPNSLIIIDELCRSTDPQEGEVLCYAYCEKLLKYIGISNDNYFKATDENCSSNDETKDINKHKNSTSLTIKGADIKLKDIARPFIFITTHFSGLIKLADKFYNAINLHMMVREKVIDEKIRLDFTYMIQSGESKMKSYGLALARCLRFPTNLIDRAEELISQVQDESLIDFLRDSRAEKSTSSVIDKTANSMTEVTKEIEKLEKDVIDLYSYVLLLMSTESNKQYHYININIINQKLCELIQTMSPQFRELLNTSSLDEIIHILNLSSD